MNLDAFRRTPEGYFTSRWGLPEYTDWIDESMSWKETCSIGDWSFLWERRFKGPEALSDTSINSLAKFDLRQSKHIVHCDHDGKIVAEGIATRLADDEFVLFDRGTFWLDFTLCHGGCDVASTAIDSFSFQVAGPNALAVVEKAAGTRLRDVKFMHSADIVIAGHPIMALRQGMPGEPGFELQGPAEYARDVYDAIVEAGGEFGLRKLGGRAVFINHLEACFLTIVVDYMPAIFGAEIEAFRTEFLSQMPAASATSSLAGSFEAGDRQVGGVTSRGYSYYFREMISLAVVDVDHAEIGNEPSVVGVIPGERQIAIRARVAPAPYKQDNRRVDLSALR